MIVNAVVDQHRGVACLEAGEILGGGILFKIADDGAAAGVALPQKQYHLHPLPLSPRQTVVKAKIGVHLQRDDGIGLLPCALLFPLTATHAKAKYKRRQDANDAKNALFHKILFQFGFVLFHYFIRLGCTLIVAQKQKLFKKVCQN